MRSRDYPLGGPGTGVIRKHRDEYPELWEDLQSKCLGCRINGGHLHFQSTYPTRILRSHPTHQAMAEIIRGQEYPDEERGFVDLIPLMSLLTLPDNGPGMTAEELSEEYFASVEQTQRDLERLRDEFSEAISEKRDGTEVWWREAEPERETFDWDEYLEQLAQEAPGVAEMFRARLTVVGEECPTCGVTIKSFEEYENEEWLIVQPCDHFIERVDIARPSDYIT